MEKFNSIDEIIEDIRHGKMVIMVDDEDRENEGDFVMSAAAVTPEAINFMALYGRGLICTPISYSIAEKLDLRPMVKSNTATHETAFTVSIDAKEGISTGISARDRAYSIQLMLKPKTTPEHFSRPGHIFPLIAKAGGVLKRRGHTEAAVDLSRLAGFSEAGVICEILREDGEQARGSELFEIAKRFNLKIGTIDDLARYIDSRITAFDDEKIIEVSRVDFPNKYGAFKLSMFRSRENKNEEHLAIHMGNFSQASLTPSVPTIVRLHSECFTGDTFGSLRCDCGDQLDYAMKKIAERGNGILIYLKQEGRGIGLFEKMRAYELQEKGYDTVEANLELGHPIDGRSYDFAGSILRFFKVEDLELLTNNPTKINALNDMGFKVKRAPVLIDPNHYNIRYYMTKKEKMGHLYN
jgi:3,4-dihydroxy 2-butanone 4-phosphate synthase/GTP cyclohydrolase II